jgi:Trk K+ transport system NAD-binding subunit
MSLWKKIKNDLEEGIETFSEKSIEISRLVKLNWELRGIQKQINREMIALGELVYRLSNTDKENQLAASARENVLKLDSLDQQMGEKEESIRDLTFQIDRKQVKGLKKDLEMGDGTIEQVVVEKNSPFVGKKLMDIQLPKNVLIGTIVRKNQMIVPDGHTIINAGDRITLLGKLDDVEEVVSAIVERQ